MTDDAARQAARQEIDRAEQEIVKARARLSEAINEAARAHQVMNDLNYLEQLRRRRP